VPVPACNFCGRFYEAAGIKLFNLFFSFTGRLGRRGFLLRGMALGIIAGAVFVAGASLFLQGKLWWLGLLSGSRRGACAGLRVVACAAPA
jgi:hypothetical protein